MSFETFKFKVQTFCDYMGYSVLEVSHNNGRHEAKLSNGDFITGNTVAPSITRMDENRNHCIQYTPA